MPAAAAATSPWARPRAPRRTAIRSSPPPATSSPTSASIRKSPTIPTRTSTPISLMCSSPHVLVVHPSVPAKNVNELVALAKASSRQIQLRLGRPRHAGASRRRIVQAHVRCRHHARAVQRRRARPPPRRSAAMFRLRCRRCRPRRPTSGAANLRALAMFSSKRSSALPDIPTMVEASGHDLPADIVNGFVAPAGTPQPIIESHSPRGREGDGDARHPRKARGHGLRLRSASTPEEFTTWIRTEIARWGKVIRDAKIALQ